MIQGYDCSSFKKERELGLERKMILIAFVYGNINIVLTKIGEAFKMVIPREPCFINNTKK